VNLIGGAKPLHQIITYESAVMPSLFDPILNSNFKIIGFLKMVAKFLEGEQEFRFRRDEKV
jgi:hypothetical protein